MKKKFVREVIINPIIYAIILFAFMGGVADGMSDGDGIKNIIIGSAAVSAVILIFLFAEAVKGWIKNKKGLTFEWVSDIDNFF